MNVRSKVKTAIVEKIRADVSGVLPEHVSKFRDRPVQFSEMPFVTVSSFDETPEKTADAYHYKITSQVLISVYCGGTEDPEQDSDELCSAIEDSLCHPLCELLDPDTSEVLCKSLDIIGTKVRRQDQSGKTVVFAAMLFEFVALREIS